MISMVAFVMFAETGFPDESATITEIGGISINERLETPARYEVKLIIANVPEVEMFFGAPDVLRMFPQICETTPAVLSMFPALKIVLEPFCLKKLPSSTLFTTISELLNFRLSCAPAIGLPGSIRILMEKLSPNGIEEEEGDTINPVSPILAIEADMANRRMRMLASAKRTDCFFIITKFLNLVHINLLI